MMLFMDSTAQYYLYPNICDMSRGINSLLGIVRTEMNSDPMSGEIFIFLCRRRRQIKLLLFEGDGYALYLKRLERGTFEFPQKEPSGQAILTSSDELNWILKGIQLESIRHRKRYCFP